MRKLVAPLIVTLDGVVGFEAVLRTIMRLRDREVLADFFRKVEEEDAMLLGRATYQQWVDYWPTSTDEPFASHINGVPKYVVSKSLDAAPWGTKGKAALLRGDLADEITALKQQPGKNIGVHGSPSLVDSLLDADLLERLRLELYPVVAGGGARLFKEAGPSRHMRLADSKITDSGVAILTYQPTSDSDTA